MKRMTLKRATQIVIELARQNVIDPRTCDADNAEDMAAEQDQAIDMVEEVLNERNNEN